MNGEWSHIPIVIVFLSFSPSLPSRHTLLNQILLSLTEVMSNINFFYLNCLCCPATLLFLFSSQVPFYFPLTFLLTFVSSLPLHFSNFYYNYPHPFSPFFLSYYQTTLIHLLPFLSSSSHAKESSLAQPYHSWSLLHTPHLVTQMLGPHTASDLAAGI